MSKLQEQRIKKGITQQELSNKTGISKRTIEAYEGKYHNLSGAKLKTLIKFCNTLDCRLEDIVEDRSLIEMIKKYYERINSESN